jgi:hypothetical protein
VASKWAVTQLQLSHLLRRSITPHFAHQLGPFWLPRQTEFVIALNSVERQELASPSPFSKY